MPRKPKTKKKPTVIPLDGVRDRIKKFRRVPASALKINDKNWRTHPAAQATVLRDVLGDIGYADAVLARELEDGTLELIDGHLRVQTTPNADIPVLVLDVTEEEADKLLLTLDPLTNMAGVDPEKLDALLRVNRTQSEHVSKMLADLAERAGLYGPNPSDGSLLTLAEVSIDDPKHQVEHNDVWSLDRHILVCIDVLAGWPVWKPFLEGDDVLFVPYPGPFAPLSLRAETARLVMVQPDPYIAGHILDQYEQLKGAGHVRHH